MSQRTRNITRLLPKAFWQDQDWAFDHYAELVKRYANRWVAVVDRQVVAASKSSVKAQEQAWAKTGRSPVAVIYLETGRHVY